MAKKKRKKKIQPTPAIDGLTQITETLTGENKDKFLQPAPAPAQPTAPVDPRVINAFPSAGQEGRLTMDDVRTGKHGGVAVPVGPADYGPGEYERRVEREELQNRRDFQGRFPADYGPGEYERRVEQDQTKTSVPGVPGQVTDSPAPGGVSGRSVKTPEEAEAYWKKLQRLYDSSGLGKALPTEGTAIEKLAFIRKRADQRNRTAGQLAGRFWTQDVKPGYQGGGKTRTFERGTPEYDEVTARRKKQREFNESRSAKNQGKPDPHAAKTAMDGLGDMFRQLQEQGFTTDQSFDVLQDKIKHQQTMEKTRFTQEQQTGRTKIVRTSTEKVSAEDRKGRKQISEEKLSLQRERYTSLNEQWVEDDARTKERFELAMTKEANVNKRFMLEQTSKRMDKLIKQRVALTRGLSLQGRLDVEKAETQLEAIVKEIEELKTQSLPELQQPEQQPARQGITPTNAPEPQAKTQLDTFRAQAILQEAGGDPNRAREIARQRGFTF